MKKNRLQNLLNKLNGTDETTLEGFRMFDEGVKKLKEQLTENIKVSTLDNVNSELKKFKAKLDFQPLVDAIDTLKENFENEVGNLSEKLESKVKELVTISKTNGIDALNKIQPLNDEMDGIKKNIGDLIYEKYKTIESLNKLADDIKVNGESLAKKFKEIDSKFEEGDKELSETEDELEKEIDDLKKSLQKTRNELQAQIANKGGSMNRKITFAGVDYLTRYTDINYKAGGTVTYTIKNNDQTKMVDVTISATGGTGGSVRVITSVATDTNAGDTSGTDYVYLCSGTLKVTLPDASGNKNLYTIKNVGTGVVTVDTTSSQTIDGDLTIIMPVQYTSVDIISDSVNWAIT